MNERILIVEVNWVGDVLFSTPFIRAVRDAYPSGRIACLIHPRCREVLANNPCVDELIVYDEEGAHRGLIGKCRLLRDLRARRFDVAYLLHRSFTKALFAYCAGIRERVGYDTKGRGMLLTKACPEPAGRHKVEYFLDIARCAGLSPQSSSYEFTPGDDDRSFAAAFFAENGLTASDRIVVINPGGNWDPKRWPKDRFAAVADRLADMCRARIVITGAAKDVALAGEIEGMMHSRPVIAAGRTTLPQLGAILARASLVIANDSGPMHLAVAVGAKVIALFGPTSPALTGPYGNGEYTVIAMHEGCAVPCYDRRCRENRCMSAITVDDVVNEAVRYLCS